ncbi:MAG: methyltransferase domain-containing protein [Nocardiopsaceae bacterium]|jgi:SAM-dependent methyltransferase|nr:methyltransferase domain-containing protein [Nocardiopsaceae bacterium]
MGEEQAHAAMRRYYERGEEEVRLDEPQGRLEFMRTKEIILRHLPPPPAVVADVGGGPGRYALWLGGLGYRVIHRDLMPLHVEQLMRASAGHAHIESMVADARELDLADRSADAVLLLGPLYHLEKRTDRLRALAESRRILRDGGPMFAAAISRWAPRMDGILRLRLDKTFPGAEGDVASLERTGRLPPFGPDAFCGYTHRPGQLRRELLASGFQVVDMVSVEGPAYLLDDLPERLADDEALRVVLESARALERVPELMGIGPHLLATVR